MVLKQEKKQKLRIKTIILIAGIVFACLIVLAIILGVVFGRKIDSDREDLTKPDNLFEIYSLEILSEGMVVESINKSFNDENFVLTCRINEGEVNFTQQNYPEIEWTFGDSGDLGCSIDENGLFSIGNRIGTVKVNVKVQSKNVFETSVSISIAAPNATAFQDLEVVASQADLEFIEGQCFDPDTVELYLTYVDIEKALYVPAYTYKNEPLTLFDTEIELEINFAEIERIVSIPIIVKPKTMQRIEITKLPDKTSYIEGQVLDLTGLEVTCHYEYISEIITDYYIDIAENTVSADCQGFTVSYISGNIVKTSEVKITVKRRQLQSIEIVSLPKKMKYVQGQKFNPDGLEITAHFEYVDTDVTDLIKWDKTNMLTVDDKTVAIFYEEDGIIKSQSIPISVDLPYSTVRKIVFENPLDATLSWIYSYSDDGESEITDNTQVDGHSNLFFDPQHGVYIAPVGAVITVMKVSPAVTGFNIDGEDYNLLYPTNSVNFELSYDDNDLEISFNKVIGDRITVRFLSDANSASWAFIYPLNYNGPLKSSELGKIAAIYEDTETYYFEYSIGQEKYSFAELCEICFSADSLIVVTKVNRIMSETITLNIEYPNGSMFNLIVERSDEFSFNKIPRIERIGYILKFSSAKNGECLDAETFKTLLATIDDGSTIYAIYELIVNNIESEITGNWYYSLTADAREVSVTVKFNSDGTYKYETIVDGNMNCSFSGIYTYKDEIVEILSLEYEGVNQLIAVDDFNVVLENNELKTYLFVIDGLTVLKGNISLEGRELIYE